MIIQSYCDIKELWIYQQVWFTHKKLLFCVEPASLSSSSKIAIGVSVVSMVAILAGITMGLLYCRRKQYTRHQPTLIDDMDDFKLWSTCRHLCCSSVQSRVHSELTQVLAFRFLHRGILLWTLLTTVKSTTRNKIIYTLSFIAITVSR